jgi:hypothetical protein
MNHFNNFKKIALVSCYYQSNYGSQLQAYATQFVLDKLGVANETIRIDGLKKEINCIKYGYFLRHALDIEVVQNKSGFLKRQLAGRLYPRLRQDFALRKEKFSAFSGNFHLSPLYHSMRELQESASNYSAFLVGSDQCWLPSNIEAGYFTLGFVPDGIPRFSLSTSFGIARMPDFQKQKAIDFLKRFDHISVRELSGRDIIKDLTGKMVPVTCDPTLLVSTQEWSDFQGGERFVKDKYILCYFLGNNAIHRVFAKRFKEKLGLKIVQLQHLDHYVPGDNHFPDYAPYDVSPVDFISLIRDAEYVLTDSFHGTIFSLLYKKPFFCFRRYRKDNTVSTNTRLYSLLSHAGMTSFLLHGDEAIDDCLNLQRDYEAAHSALARLRETTFEYLLDVLHKIGMNEVDFRK